MPSDSVDAIVCDPPYGIGFMGRAWDSFSPLETARKREQKRRKGTESPAGSGEMAGGAFIEYDRTCAGNHRFQEWVTEWAREALRVVKPGGHIVAFGGTRTWHRLAAGIEDAGWELRDNLAWLFGSGFPKSRNVSKDIDAMLGANRAPDEYSGPNGKNGVYGANMGGGVTLRRSDPCTAAAAGYGTALKPAFEPCVLARKPLSGTIATTFMAHGTGALNIDGCRIEYVDNEDKAAAAAAAAAAQRLVHAEPGAVMSGLGKTGFTNGPASLAPYLASMDAGRWPANVLMDEEAASILDEQAGDHPGMSGGGVHRADYAGGMFGAIDCAANARNDSGGPSRFFFVSKGDDEWASEDRSQNDQTDVMSPEKATSVGSQADDSECSTTLSGNASEAPSRKASRSTTRTKTRQTTESTTLNSSTVSPTSDCTADARSGTGSGGSRAESAETRSQSTQSTGTSRKKAGRSTGDADRVTSDESSQKNVVGVRFHYSAKAARSERDAGLDDFHPVTGGAATARTDGTDGLNSPRAGAGRKGGARNTHCTVKPVDLMRWLVRLVGRPGALILDPFTGSGSTGVAAVLEGMRFVGLELEPLHVDFARARIAHVIGGTWEREVKPERPVEKKQPGLFDAIGAGK